MVYPLMFFCTFVCSRSDLGSVGIIVPPSRLALPQINGMVHKPNGIPSQLNLILNGVHSTPKSGPKAKPNGSLHNGHAHTPSRSLPVGASPASTPSSTVGKKRKKSLG